METTILIIVLAGLLLPIALAVWAAGSEGDWLSGITLGGLLALIASPFVLGIVGKLL